MTWLDWAVVALFFVISIWLGTVFTARAGKSLNAYFTSNHSLSWWLAGTSIAATAFSSDTPLLITGMVRSKGIWGTWELPAARGGFIIWPKGIGDGAQAAVEEEVPAPAIQAPVARLEP